MPLVSFSLEYTAFLYFYIENNVGFHMDILLKASYSSPSSSVCCALFTSFTNSAIGDNQNRCLKGDNFLTCMYSVIPSFEVSGRSEEGEICVTK